MTREQEQKLIAEVCAGNPNAFEALVKENQNRVYTLALRMVGNPEDAEDLAQEAFLRAYNALPGFLGESKFSVWLHRLTSNLCIDFLRKRKGRQTISLTVDDEDDADEEFEIPDLRFSPENELLKAEMREAIHRGLEQLPPDYKEILLLREVSSFSYQEIGETLGLSEGTVKSRIFRARKKLCDFLMESGNIDAP